MPVTFVKTSNATAVAGVSGTALGAAGQDVYVHKIIVGAPVNSGNIALYHITNPQPSFSTNNDAQLAFKYTYTSSVSESSLRVIDFTSNGTAGGEQLASSQGLQLNQGGNIMIDQTMLVTVIWDFAA